MGSAKISGLWGAGPRRACQRRGPGEAVGAEPGPGLEAAQGGVGPRS